MKKHGLILIAIIAITICIISGVTVAWLSYDATRHVTMTMGDINQGIYVDFNGTSAASYYDSATETLLTDGTLNNTSVNNILDLNVTLYITPEIATYFRIRVMDEWNITRTYKNFDKQTNETVAHYSTETLFPFTLVDDTKWYLNIEDGYYYYNELLLPGETYVIPFIDGGTCYNTKDNRIYYEICDTYLNFYLDCVQANRYHEIWGVDDTFLNGGGA